MFFVTPDQFVGTLFLMFRFMFSMMSFVIACISSRVSGPRGGGLLLTGQEAFVRGFRNFAHSMFFLQGVSKQTLKPIVLDPAHFIN